MTDVTRKDSRYEDWEAVFTVENAPPDYVYRLDRGLRVSVNEVHSVMRDDGPSVCAIMWYSPGIGGEIKRITVEYGDNDAAAYTLIESFEGGQIDVPEVDVDEAEG